MSGPYRRSLEVVNITLPCTESWSRMEGDDSVRYCRKCASNVYDLSMLTGAEAEELLSFHEGRICVRLHRRRDGTLITKDCAPARRDARVHMARRTIVASALACLAVMGAALGRWIVPGSNSAERPAPIGSRDAASTSVEVGGIMGTLEDDARYPTWVDPTTIEPMDSTPPFAPFGTDAIDTIEIGGVGGLPRTAR